MARFHQARAAASLLACVAATSVVAGCSSRERSTEPPTAEAVNTLICGHFPIVGPGGHAVDQPEYYRLSAMNRKLQLHPEFASAIGMKSVSDCEGARQFYVEYENYLTDHPGVDLSVPLEIATEPKYIPEPVAPPAAPDAPKIFNGVKSTLNPVVSIKHFVEPGRKYWDNSGTIPQGFGHCSGTFIAKNWILTAAHCIASIALAYDPTASSGAADWLTSAIWNIQWQSSLDAQGSLTGRPLIANVRAISIVSPDFIGVTNGKLPASRREPAATSLKTTDVPLHDVALLYINPFDWDTVLPNVASAPQTTLYVSTDSPNIVSSTFTAYGYGATSEATQGSDSLQTKADLPKFPTLDSDFYTLFIQHPPPGFTFASLCEGDSGGPVVRQTSLGPAIVAVNSQFIAPLLPGGFLGHCGSGSDDISRISWTRIDQHINFIQQAMLKFVGFPTHDPTTGLMIPPQVCTKVPDAPGSPTSSMIQCWGSACRSDCDCPSASFYCSNPAQDPSRGARSCATCFTGQGDLTGNCDCVVGQCLRKPDSFPVENPDAGCPNRP